MTIRCPRCSRDTVLVEATRFFRVSELGITDYHRAVLWEQDALWQDGATTVHDDYPAFCQRGECQWSGTLAEAIEAAQETGGEGTDGTGEAVDGRI